MTARLELRLLGKPQVHLDGVAVTDFRTAKVEALLYYLAVTGQPHSRETLADLLWGEMPEATAKRNLTQALSLLRKRFEPFLAITPQQIGFKPGAAYWVDVVEFQITSSQGPGAGDRSPAEASLDPSPLAVAALRQAVELYRGDFLESFYLKDAYVFEEWALAERERLREVMLQALHTLVSEALRRDEIAAGLDYAGRLLALEPWRETTHRHLMLLLARSGRREAALAQYETCRRILAEELGIEPMAETTALYERLKARGTPPPHNLPSPPNTFVGRETELQQIGRHLADPACRLLTIVGPGGIGKTRLALEAARRYVQADTGFPAPDVADGIYFVSLAAIAAGHELGSNGQNPANLTNAMITAVAGAIGFSFQGGANLEGQLLNYLRPKALLLILDNIEHLLTSPVVSSPIEGLPFLTGILQQAPQVKLLVTSRERLNWQEEWVMEIEGLTYPRRGENYSPLLPLSSSSIPYTALTLFLYRAQQTLAGFTLTETDLPQVVRICQLVEGMPLALELAASWLRILSCTEIAAEIERSLDFLGTSLRNMPARHRSVRAVFEHAWALLSPEDQRAFSQLAVFRGGFGREAAAQVAGASLSILSRLVDKSFIRRTAHGRYELHELMRQYAHEKLWLANDDRTGPDDFEINLAQNAWQRHSRYYLDLVSRQEVSLQGNTPHQTITELRADLDNIRQAWQWAVIAGEIEELARAIGGLARFYDLTSLFQEGAAVFRQAADDLQAHLRSADEAAKLAIERTVVKLWVEQARLLNRRGLSEKALQVIPKAAELAHHIQDTHLEALAYHQWGETLSFHGQPVLSQARLEEALRLARAAGLGAIEAEALRHLGISWVYQGDPTVARQLYEESLACYRRLSDRRGEGLVLNSLANLQRGQGQLPEAETNYQQALQIFQEIDYLWGQDAVLNNLGNLRYDVGHYSQAQALYQQGLQTCREINDYWGECHLLNSLGNIMREQGDFFAAQNYYEQALQLWRDIGARLYEGVTLAELALLWHLREDNERAYDYAQQAEQIGQKVSSPQIRATALTHLGHAQGALGLLPEASESYQQALTLYRALNQEHFVLEVLAGLIRTSLAQDQLEQVQIYGAELLPQLKIEKLHGVRQPFGVYLTGYQLLRAAQDSRAQGVLETAYQLLQERAAAIEDEQQRRLFLENVPAHRELAREFQQQPT